MPDAHDVLFRTLADPTRRALFERLCRDGEQTVGALAPLIDWTSQMAGFWQSRFDRLEDLLKRMDQ